MNSLNLDVPQALISATTTNTAAVVWALPAKTNTITWQLYSTTNPSAITATLSGGLVESELQSLDSSTTTTGFVRTINTNATFVGVAVSGLGAGGSGINVYVVAKAL